MAFKTIRISLELDERGFIKKTQRAGKTVSSLRHEFDNTSRSLRRMEHHLTSSVARIRDFLIVTSVMSRGLQTLGRATVGWQYGIVKTNAEIERMTMLLRGMSNATTAVGRSADASKSISDMFEMAKSTPFSINELTNSFVKFKSVGLDPMDGSLKSLTDAVAAFGGNDQILHRASVAIQQMAGKGVISMEELRQQLGEAVPNAIGLMARSMGLSYQDLVTMVSRGQVEAKSALKLTMQEMERTMGGSGQRMMSTWSGMVSVLSTKWTELQVEIGNSEFFATAKNALEDLIHSMDSEAIKNFADNLGRAMSGFVVGLQNTVEWVVENRENIVRLSKAMLGLFLVMKAKNIVVALTTSLASLNRSTLAIGYSNMRAAGQTRAYAQSHKFLASSIGLSTIATRTATTALTALGGPVGIIVLALGAAATAWSMFGGAADEAMKKIRDGQLASNAKELSELEELLAKKNKIHESNLAARASLEEKFFSYARSEEDYQKQKALAVARANNKIIQSEKDKNDLENNIALSRQAMLDRHTEIGKRKNKRALQDDTDALRAEYDDQMKFMDSALRDGFSKKSFIKEQEFAVNDLYEGIVALHETNIASISEKMKSGNFSDALKTQMQAQIDASKAEIDGAKKKLEEQLDSIKQGVTLTAGTTGTNPLKSMATYIKGIEKRTEGLQAKTAGLSGEVAKFDYMVKGMDPAKFAEKLGYTIEEAREKVEKFAEAAQKLKDTKAAEKGWKSLATALSQTGQSFDDTMQAISSNGLSGENSSLNALRKQLDKIVTAMPAATRGLKKTKDLLDSIMTNATNSQTAEYVRTMQERTNAIKTSLLSEKDQIEANYKRELELAADRVDTSKMNADERLLIENQYNEHLIALQNKHIRDTEGPAVQMLRNWQDTTSAMGDATAGWLSGAADALTDFVMTGKASFADFARSIVADLMRIYIRQQMVGIFAGAMSPSTANQGIAGQTGYTGGAAGVLDGSEFANFATGGIMTKYGKASLNAYANGGIANSPQLALFGEGSRPEAYVPLPDGKSIPVSMNGGGAPEVHVNVINQSGQQLSAKQKGSSFDGKRMILDVVLDAVNKPGTFRDGMKGAMG